MAMQPIVDYQTLLAAAAVVLDRKDIGDYLPVCVGAATATFNRLLRVREMERRSVATITAPAEFVDLPDDLLEIKRIRPITTPPSLALKSFTYDQFQQEMVARPATLPPATVPSYFARYGDQIMVGPPATGSTAPGPSAGTYELEILYLGAISTLSNAGPTNWMITKHPDIYLWQTLVATAPFLRDDERIGVWQGLANAGMEQLIVANERTELQGGTMAPFGRPVA